MAREGPRKIQALADEASRLGLSQVFDRLYRELTDSCSSADELAWALYVSMQSSHPGFGQEIMKGGSGREGRTVSKPREVGDGGGGDTPNLQRPRGRKGGRRINVVNAGLVVVILIVGLAIVQSCPSLPPLTAKIGTTPRATQAVAATQQILYWTATPTEKQLREEGQTEPEAVATLNLMTATPLPQVEPEKLDLVGMWSTLGGKLKTNLPRWADSSTQLKVAGENYQMAQYLNYFLSAATQDFAGDEVGEAAAQLLAYTQAMAPLDSKGNPDPAATPNYKAAEAAGKKAEEILPGLANLDPSPSKLVQLYQERPKPVAPPAPAPAPEIPNGGYTPPDNYPAPDPVPAPALVPTATPAPTSLCWVEGEPRVGRFEARIEASFWLRERGVNPLDESVIKTVDEILDSATVNPQSCVLAMLSIQWPEKPTPIPVPTVDCRMADFWDQEKGVWITADQAGLEAITFAKAQYPWCLWQREWEMNLKGGVFNWISNNYSQEEHNGCTSWPWRGWAMVVHEYMGAVCPRPTAVSTATSKPLPTATPQKRIIDTDNVWTGTVHFSIEGFNNEAINWCYGHPEWPQEYKGNCVAQIMTVVIDTRPRTTITCVECGSDPYCSCRVYDARGWQKIFVPSVP